MGDEAKGFGERDDGHPSLVWNGANCDRRVVYKGDTMEWPSYQDEKYDYFVEMEGWIELQELTEEKEKELVTNGRWNCSKFTVIAVIIKSATILGGFWKKEWEIGCNLAAQNRLLSNSVSNINEIVLRFVNQAIARIQDPKDPLVKGEAAIEWTLKNILITCEDVLKTHM